MEAILHIGIAQCFFAALLIATKKPLSLADKILASWLIVIAGLMVSEFLGVYASDFQKRKWNNLAISLLAFGPFLYLYARNLISEIPRYKNRHNLHFVPFFFFMILGMFYIDKSVTIGKSFFYADKGLWLRIIYVLFFLISIIYYPIRVVRIILRHQRNIDNLYSFHSEKINLNWLKYITIIFSLTFFLTMLATIITFYSENSNPLLVIYLGFTIFAFSVSYFGIKQPALFGDIKHSENFIPMTISTPEEHNNHLKYEKSGLRDEDADNYINQITSFMEKDKPYLNGDLTIQDISDKLNIPKHYITQVINEKLQKNFYNFINEYRVEEAKRLIKDPNNKKEILLSIGWEVGFNSKSSFYSSFKKITGMTPALYRKMYTGVDSSEE